MLTAVISTGLACGMLLAAVGLTLWGGFRQTPGLPQAVQAVGWLAGATLLVGALLAWRGDYCPPAPTLRLILMAALAAPPGIRRWQLSPWSNVMLILPALILAGSGLFLTSTSTGAEIGSPTITPMEMVVVACGGLAARALGEALGEMVAPTQQVGWTSTAAYALLTLLVSGTTLVNLWQRGAMWRGSANEGGLAGAWLVWSAVWLTPPQRSRQRAGLIIVAATLLVSVVLKCA